jgi:hypothetical protein
MVAFHKNTLIANPKTNTYSFGVIPEIKNGKMHFAQGEVFLKYGQHIARNRGFGVAHIWAEHYKELAKLGYNTENISLNVAHYISDIIVSGIPLFCEFNDIRGNHRIAAIRHHIGVCYVEEKTDNSDNIYYSVVTAFRNAKPRGTRIGSVA